MNKNLNKDKQKSIRLAKKYFSNRFLKAVELIQSDLLLLEDVTLFCENEPTISYVLEQIKKKAVDEAKKQTNKTILTRDISLIDYNIENTKKEMVVLRDEFSRIMFIEPNTPEEAIHKQSELNYYLERINACEIILEDLESCKNKHFKVSRGRPKKKDEKNILELAKEIKDVDSEGLTLDDRIIADLRNLTIEKKKYLLEYINRMIEVEKELE